MMALGYAFALHVSNDDGYKRHSHPLTPSVPSGELTHRLLRRELSRSHRDTSWRRSIGRSRFTLTWPAMASSRSKSSLYRYAERAGNKQQLWRVIGAPYGLMGQMDARMCSIFWSGGATRSLQTAGNSDSGGRGGSGKENS
jgi:hypothetical protein